MTDPVSRETTPPAPDEARGVFVDGTLACAQAYVEMLATDGIVRGLIGPREVPRLWERHVLNCGVLTEALPTDARVCDLGSGAGLPGLVLAIARPDLHLTLVEPLLRRTTFLEEVVAALRLTNVEVFRGRADALHGGDGFDVVTSRAVADLSTLLDWSMPLVRPAGILLAMKGSGAYDEIASAATTLAAWGCAEPEVLTVGRDVVSPPTTLVRVAWRDPAAISWPPVRTDSRSSAAPTRRPARKKSSRPSRQQRQDRDR